MLLPNKLLTNIITGSAIVASLATSGVAGYKVLASREVNTEVPDVPSSAETPLPSPIVEGNRTSVSEPLATEFPTPTPSAIVGSQASESQSDFPVASPIGAGFDDDEDDDEIESEEEKLEKSEKSEAEHKEKLEEKEDEHEDD